MPKFIDEVLSEIVGVPCGNVKFTLERNSLEFFDCKEYVRGRVQCFLEFTTLEKINPLTNYRFGSLIVRGAESNKCSAVLLSGKETARITQAIADMCVVE
jgi:hypothetical protein